jgi:DNA-binding CsgD family transcriptional regulator
MRENSLLERATAFAAECERIATMDALAKGVAAVVAPSGYSAVASGRLGRTGEPEAFHFANWDPGWRDLYLSKRFMRIDPVPIWAVCCGVPASAGELRARLPRNHPGHRVFEAGRPFGYNGGYIVPQRAADNQLGIVAFVGKGDPQNAEERFALRALAGVVFDRADALSGYSPPRFLPQPPPELTGRERECLKHLIAGRSTADIAAAMRVSEATVRFHAGNLKSKTGAANRAELAALAISLGLAPHRAPDVEAPR